MKRTHRTRQGFTIVELLIVVVVIAILAAITIVAYNGITNQAKEATLKSDLTNGAKQLGVAKIDDGSYPADDSTLKKSGDTAFQYSAGAHTFCLSASSASLPGKAFHITESGSVRTGSCPSNIAGSMQAFTPAQCSALTTFTGVNNEAVMDLTDNRGGITRTYQVAKLADGKCWMLANLKLGSTTGDIVLTPSDSDVSANFTLPQLTAGGEVEYDLPRVYGPVPDDTGSGATNYGYLYNWSAATSGESRTSHPEIAGNAPKSICPANWRLPGGGERHAIVNEFSTLEARMYGLSGPTDPDYINYNYPSESIVANWQFGGPFKGTFAGMWEGVFGYSVVFGYWWSSSAHPSGANVAFAMIFSGVATDPGDNYLDRYSGLSVRCLLR